MGSLLFQDNYCQVDRLLFWFRISVYRSFQSMNGNCGRPAGVVYRWVFCYCFVFVGLAESKSVSPRLAGVVWESPILEKGRYDTEVEQLIQAYETEVRRPLKPGVIGKVALKINTRGGGGISTPLPLIRAVVRALEQRGYSRDSIWIVDDSSDKLREAGVMPPLSQAGSVFEGCPVLAWDTGEFYKSDWFYESPLPPILRREAPFPADPDASGSPEEKDSGRKSFLPVPLLFDVDFWINLAVGVDDPALGVDGVLANATLWNVSNSRRFLVNQTTASAAVAEIAAIPELAEHLVLNFVSLERYQFIAGPFFNSLYTRSEPYLWMSADPVALDRLLYDRMNAIRVFEGFPEISPMPRQLYFAASLGLGEFERERIDVRKLIFER